MAGCARTCVLWLLGWAGAAAAFYVYFRGFGILEPHIYWASGGAGLCVAIAVSYVVGIVNSFRERSMLLEASVGATPDDGKWVAVSGHIHALSPLRSPLSATSAAVYEYKISRMVRSGKSGSSEISLYDGKALVPSTIATRHGTVRLLSVPTLDVKPEDLSDQVARANAQRYIEATQFQTRRTPKDKRVGVEQESTDEDGNFRRDDYYPPESEVDLAACMFSEKVIRQNEAVCAFGLYSRQRGGLIPHPNWAKQTRIMRGDATTVAGQLRGRMIKYAIGLIIVSAIVYGIVKAYTHYAGLIDAPIAWGVGAADGSKSTSTGA
jgi:hypothetical protein